MPKTVSKALGKNHYDFVSKLLNKDPAITKDSKFDDDMKKQLITDLELEQADLAALGVRNQEQEETFQKLQRTIDTFKDDGKKKLYDQGLAAKAPSITVKPGEAEPMAIVPLIPIDKLKEEFDSFAKPGGTNSLVGKDKAPPGTGKYEATDFKYERQKGPPAMDVFTFPDQASADAFVKHLFDKNMAMKPGGSQDLADMKAAPPAPTASKGQPTLQSPPEVPKPTPGVPKPTPGGLEKFPDSTTPPTKVGKFTPTLDSIQEVAEEDEEEDDDQVDVQTNGV